MVGLGLSPSEETISGFIVDPDEGGPLCPLEMLFRVPSHHVIEAFVVKVIID